MSETVHDMPGPLREILTEPVSSVERCEASAIGRMLEAHRNRVVLFGCGGLGRRAVAKLSGLDARPLAFCDNNAALWGTEIEGIPVLSVAQAAAQFGRDALFLIAVWNPHHWYGETSRQLKAAGVRSVTSYLPLYWRFPNDFLQVYLLNDLPAKVYRAKEDVLAAEKLWGDDFSLSIYRANILWRALGEAEYMPPRPAENTYFPVDLFRPLANECILDCGAYIGDTVGQILGVCGETFAAIYPFEGDAVSFGKLSEYVASLGDEVSRRIHPIHGAIGGARGVVRFGGDGGTGSAMNAGDGVDVQCYPLDELSFAAPVTIIKMDIEGAEYEALHGARETIARDRPLLAICVYHTQCDLWRIPLLVHSMLPDHRLFLRAYEGDGFQTVLYAVPPARLLPDAGRASTHGG